MSLISFLYKIFKIKYTKKDSDIIFNNPTYNNDKDSILEVRGINSKGHINYYKCYNTIDISRNDLVSIDIPEGITHISCNNNKLTSLNLPKSLIALDCSNNKISKLILPPNIRFLRCFNNRIKELYIPSNMLAAFCFNNPIENIIIKTNYSSLQLEFDKNIKCLEKYIGKYNIILK